MRYWLLFIFLFFSILSQAQKTELGFQVGASTYYGDLAPSISMSETHPAFGAFVRRNLSNTWAIKTELNRYTVSGNDNNFSYNAPRNLSFQSHINEAAMVVEFNYLKYGPYVLDKKYTSYVYLGVAGFEAIVLLTSGFLTTAFFTTGLIATGFLATAFAVAGLIALEVATVVDFVSAISFSK